MDGRGTYFRDAHGDMFCVVNLSATVATERATDLLRAHNLIPSQKWTIDQLLADGDGARQYFGKWDVSRVAIAGDGGTIGFCIGFELVPDFQYYHERCFYLHRLAILPEFRGRMIGPLLQAETVVGCFVRGFHDIGSVRDPVVICGQTDMADWNRAVRLFHQAAGFRVVGQKPYPARTDAIMKMDADSFWRSDHVALWRRQRAPEGVTF
jgi:GNAT superfamily N-acetyltransferase